MKPSIEKISLTTIEDEGLRQKWGDNIYLINFNQTNLKATNAPQFVVAP